MLHFNFVLIGWEIAFIKEHSLQEGVDKLSPSIGFTRLGDHVNWLIGEGVFSDVGAPCIFQIFSDIASREHSFEMQVYGPIESERYAYL